MQEYFVNIPLSQYEVIELPSDKAHHAFRVLRLDHETVRLVSGGIGWFAEVYQDSGRGLARILEQDEAVNELNCDITLCMALIKRDKFELVLQKATELGVKRIVPFVSSRCVVKTKEDRRDRQKERFEAILVEASEQCKRNAVPELCETVRFSKLADYKSELNLAAYEKAGQTAKRIASFEPAASVTVVIGPEGGFTVSEVEELVSFGFEPVTLGNRILRAETAAMHACSVIGELFQ